MTIKAPYCEVCAARDKERLERAEALLKTLPIEKQYEIRKKQWAIFKDLFIPYEPHTLNLLCEKEEEK